MRAPDFTQPVAASSGPPPWWAPRPSEIAGCALPALALGDRLLLRALALLSSRQIAAMRGLQHVRAASDPFILVANHSSRRESVLVPAILFLHRGGRRIHFLADWNFKLIPGVALVYARGQVVTVTRKLAKPRFFNVLKPLYSHPQSTLERARAHLVVGRSLGIFPEGQVNRDPDHLLRGRRGATRLSLATGIPVVPMGIRFLGGAPGPPVLGNCVMQLEIGAPLVPPAPVQARAR